MTKNIIETRRPISALSAPRADFKIDDFENSIYQKGYEVVFEKALRCPCNYQHPLLDCQNCLGTGYFFINPTKTIALLTSINQNNEYKNWTDELLGTVSITVRDVNKINVSYFDRMTIKNEFSYFSENLIVREVDGQLFVFTTYKPIEVLSIHSFVSSKEKLNKIENNTIKEDNPYCIIINDERIIEGSVVSVYYKFELCYRIIDLPHIVRASWAKNKNTGRIEKIQLPIQAIGRLCHLISLDKPNFDGSGIISNDNVL